MSAGRPSEKAPLIRKATLLYDMRPERGEKRTCLSCETRFYDLARVPVICPKCGAEYVEVVRAAPAPRQYRKKWPMGRGSAQPLDAEDEGNPAIPSPRSEDEEHVAAEEGDEGEDALDDEAEPAEEVEDVEG